jgi:hypothetical protein
VDLLQTFVSRRIQPLRRWEGTMWVYPGPGCPDRSFSAVLDDAKVDAQIRRVLVLGANWNSGPSPTALREGAISPWVSPLKLIPV